ncbi:MAG: Signal transduction histidine kinase [Verrucomicrobiaceae bacterium]|nr:Signal transduction histidine kinase [Verrucomicrobiaceae bacterium]
MSTRTSSHTTVGTTETGSPPDEVEQLKLANHYLRVALDQVKEGVIMLDSGPLDGTGPRVLYSNVPIACQVGVEPGKGLRGLHLCDLVGNERDAVALLGALKDAAAGGAAECQAQIQTFYSRGSQYCRWRVKALHNSMKRLLNFTITVEPIQNEFSVQTPPAAPAPKVEDVEAQNERMRIENLAAMAQGIAHDVNNLLGPITAQLSLVLPQLAKETELAQTLDMVLAAVRRAKQFTTQVVKSAKARHSIRQPSDVAEIIRETVRLAQAGSNVQVRIHTSPDLPAAMADPVKVTQVLQNLVMNGIQAMPNGGFMDVEARLAEIRLGQETPLKPGRYVQVIVRDRGAGISPDNMQRLFKESFTTKEDGNGIGLTTCKRFIEEHEGTICVDSTVNVGTEFRFYLPVATKAAEKPAAPREMRSLKDGAGAVMIVDDEDQIRRVAAWILKRCGYTVYESSSGEAAVKTYQSMARAGRPLDLVLMDLTLKGGMGGLETACEIWKFDPAAKIIVSSGSVTEEVQRGFLDQGFFAILPKPYEATELSDAVFEAVMMAEAMAV